MKPLYKTMKSIQENLISNHETLEIRHLDNPINNEYLFLPVYTCQGSPDTLEYRCIL